MAAERWDKHCIDKVKATREDPNVMKAVASESKPDSEVGDEEPSTEEEAQEEATMRAPVGTPSLRRELATSSKSWPGSSRPDHPRKRAADLSDSGPSPCKRLAECCHGHTND